VSALVELLRDAFPRDASDEPICAWDGRSRQRDHALCRSCWRSVSDVDRARYMAMQLEDRAKWILANGPAGTGSR
jgi:hypothetical protein